MSSKNFYSLGEVYEEEVGISGGVWFAVRLLEP